MSFCQEIIGKTNEWKGVCTTAMEANYNQMFAAENDTTQELKIL